MRAALHRRPVLRLRRGRAVHPLDAHQPNCAGELRAAIIASRSRRSRRCRRLTHTNTAAVGAPLTAGVRSQLTQGGVETPLMDAANEVNGRQVERIAGNFGVRTEPDDNNVGMIKEIFLVQSGEGARRSPAPRRLAPPRLSAAAARS